MTYHARYRAGEHGGVWRELTALGASVREPVLIKDAWAVAEETMTRVATNIDYIVERLLNCSYQFDVYLDGTAPSVTLPVRRRPDSALLADVVDLEQRVGPIPLSLRAFWQVVGTVSLIGRAPEGWPDYTDPLFVSSPEYALFELRERGPGGEGVFMCGLAPDVLHKDNGLTLGDLCTHLDMTRQAVTKHLGLLESANLVVTVWRGREKLHYLNPTPLHEISERWISKYETRRLEALGNLKRALEETKPGKHHGKT